MPSDFDIIVRGKESGEVRLICEAKLSSNHLQDAEKQFKGAMARLGCPLGLLFTPEILRIYLDRYLSNSAEESVALLGEFQSRPLLEHLYTNAQGARLEAEQFENAVQRWLETLPQTFSSEAFGDQNLAGILAAFVVPAIASGNVGAAAPR